MDKGSSISSSTMQKTPTRPRVPLFPSGSKVQQPSPRMRGLVALASGPMHPQTQSCLTSPVQTPKRAVTGPPVRSLESEGRIRVVTKMRQVSRMSNPLQGLELDDKKSSVELTVQDTWPKKTYNLDAFYGPKHKPAHVFCREIEPLLGHVCNGDNATVFAYGPTGSGKTYLMQGDGEEDGLIQLTARWLLEGGYAFDVKLAYYELYCDRVLDLIGGGQLQILETADGADCISGLQHRKLSSYEDFKAAFATAATNRQTAFTMLNATSSRSHAILELSCWDREGERELGKLRLLDLAGSENNSITGNKGKQMQESCWINESLFHLGMVIDALSSGPSKQQLTQQEGALLMTKDAQQPILQQHIGYRACKLTRVLKDTLGGTSQGVMIACLKPGSLADTQRCLALAAKSRQIKKPLDTDQHAKQHAGDLASATKARKEKLLIWQATKNHGGTPVRLTGALGSSLVPKCALAPGEYKKVVRSGSHTVRPTSSSRPAAAATPAVFSAKKQLAFGSAVLEKPDDAKTKEAGTPSGKWVNIGTTARPNWLKAGSAAALKFASVEGGAQSGWTGHPTSLHNSMQSAKPEPIEQFHASTLIDAEQVHTNSTFSHVKESQNSTGTPADLPSDALCSGGAFATDAEVDEVLENPAAQLTSKTSAGGSAGPAGSLRSTGPARSQINISSLCPLVLPDDHCASVTTPLTPPSAPDSADPVPACNADFLARLCAQTTGTWSEAGVSAEVNRLGDNPSSNKLDPAVDHPVRTIDIGEAGVSGGTSAGTAGSQYLACVHSANTVTAGSSPGTRGGLGATTPVHASKSSVQALRERSPNVDQTSALLQGLCISSTPSVGATPEASLKQQTRLVKNLAEHKIVEALNTAPEMDLVNTFKGIGKVYAARISEQRAQATPGKPAFQSVDDLQKVGMTPKKISVVKDHFVYRTFQQADE